MRPSCSASSVRSCARSGRCEATYAAVTEAENAAAWRDPGQVLEIMTRRSATFQLRDLDRQLGRRIADPEERAAVRGARAGSPGHGTGILEEGEVGADQVARDGQRVVIGAGASAMDVAATALENGAREARLLVRRSQMPLINKSKGSGNPGMAHGYWALPDEWKWRFRHYIQAQQVPPPQGSTLRVSRHAQAHFHFDVEVQEACMVGHDAAP